MISLLTISWYSLPMATMCARLSEATSSMICAERANDNGNRLFLRIARGTLRTSIRIGSAHGPEDRTRYVGLQSSEHTQEKTNATVSSGLKVNPNTDSFSGSWRQCHPRSSSFRRSTALACHRTSMGTNSGTNVARKRHRGSTRAGRRIVNDNTAR